MLFIADDAVETLLLPERPGALQAAVDLQAGPSLPALQDRFQRQRARRQGPHDGVDVVGHHDVAIHLMANPIILMDGLEQNRCNIAGSQNATAHALVEPDLLAAHYLASETLLVVGRAG